MEKKFLDKQGLAELNKSFKDEFASKSDVPTKLSQLENDKNYVDITKVNELILQASGLKKEVHESLPTSGKDNILYLIKDNKGKESNIYLEYLWIDNKFELIGSTDVDLGQYVKKEGLASYAKKEDVKTKLSELTEDSTHRAVTDDEKAKWNDKVDKVDGKNLSSNDYTNADKAKVDAIPTDPKYTDTVTTINGKTGVITKEDLEGLGIGGIDKQYLYDILFGESLVTRKAGEWSVVHGKPTSIGDGAFESNQLTNVSIPDSVTSIGNGAFYRNRLTSVVIPYGVKSIGDGAFANNQLFSVIILGRVESIGDGAFYHNQLTSIVIPGSVASIGNGAFESNQLTNVSIPDSVTSIGNGAFYRNRLTSVVIPYGVKSIGDGAFANNQLKEVKIPQKCKVADKAFDKGVNIIRY